MRKRLVATLLVAGAAVGAGVLFSGGGHAASVPSSHTLVPANMTGLTSHTTALPAVPSKVARVFPEAVPSPGSVHVLGGGAYAWIAGRTICWVAQAGGCVSALPQPLIWVIRDPDQTGGGQSVEVFGLAVDSVNSVTVTLKDGRTATAAPNGNFFTMSLPANALPWDVKTVSAQLADGTRFNAPATSRQ